MRARQGARRRPLHQLPQENFVERVKALTGGKGVPVVYDSVEKDTLHRIARLPAARRIDGELRNSSGAVPPFELVCFAKRLALPSRRPDLGSPIPP